VDASLAGLAVAVAGPGVPPAASLLLAPQDWDVHVARNGAAGCVAVLLGVGSVTACLSVAAAEALSDLAAALTPGGSGGSSSFETPAPSTGGSAAPGDPPASSPQQQFSGQHTDDLACGLFSLSPELAGRPGQIPLPPSFVPTSDAVCPLHSLQMSIERRPDSSSFHAFALWSHHASDSSCRIAGPMQISLGDRAAGYLPWAGGGESWVCWRYSHPRPVAVLELARGPPQLAQADFELGYLDPASGEFIALPVRRSVVDGANVVLTVQASS